ncbi:hypothetical protein HZH68_003727 [Vespula germanica]|uniref:Uncharacterized protein n=1 Tax=Vespula germanica TaxID=30212 RepID=A0A834NPS5_VESGE|nr:hypothetical protein HZH68_003727 [Vespula germanica]
MAGALSENAPRPVSVVGVDGSTVADLRLPMKGMPRSPQLSCFSATENSFLLGNATGGFDVLEGFWFYEKIKDRMIRSSVLAPSPPPPSLDRSIQCLYRGSISRVSPGRLVVRI